MSKFSDFFGRLFQSKNKTVVEPIVEETVDPKNEWTPVEKPVLVEKVIEEVIEEVKPILIKKKITLKNTDSEVKKVEVDKTTTASTQKVDNKPKPKPRKKK